MKFFLSSTIVRGLLAASVGLSGLFFAMPSQAEEVTSDQPILVAEGKPTLAEIAGSNSNFSILTKLLDSLGVVGELNDPNSGPYTVFAPTDAAFNALPEGTIDKLLLPENRDLRAKILAYHVLPGSVTASELTSGRYKTATTEGLLLNISASESGVKANSANVVKADVLASNGVIHVVDSVIIPAQ